MGGNLRPRSSWLPRPLVVACLAAALLMLSDGLPVVHATIPYYPYQCPIGSGGRDFDGDGHEGTVGLGLPSWDPRNGLWFSAGQGPDPVWGTWGDIPTPGNFNSDATTTSRSSGPRLEHGWCTAAGAAIAWQAAHGSWGTAGDIPVPADYNQDGTTDYGVWRPSTGQLVRSQRGDRLDAGQRRGLGSVRGLSDCGQTHRWRPGAPWN